MIMEAIWSSGKPNMQEENRAEECPQLLIYEEDSYTLHWRTWAPLGDFAPRIG
jgi:hypothetical protein